MFEGPIFIRPEQGSQLRPYPSAIAAVGPLTKINMPANTSAFLSVAGIAGLTAFTIPAGKSLVGYSVCRNTANVTGTWQLRLKKNGSIVHTSTAVAVTRVLNYYTSNLVSFPSVRGDTWTAKLITSSGYQSITGDFNAFLWFQ
jgi:hypothetical protein